MLTAWKSVFSKPSISTCERKNKNYKIFIWTHFEHDNAVEEEPKTPDYKENNYYLVRFNQGNFDTINKNNKELEKQFSNLLRKK